MPPYSRTGRESPLTPADIPRPDVARDPGVRASPVAQEVPQTIDPTGRALETVAARQGAAYNNLARGMQSLSSDLMATGTIYRTLFEQQQELENRSYNDRANIEYNKKHATIVTEMLNGPDAGRPDFVDLLDKRLAEAQKQTHEQLTANGDYFPSDKGRRLADHTMMTQRAAALRGAAVQAHNQRISLRVDQTRDEVVEIARVAAQTGDYTNGFVRADAALDKLSGVLAPDKLRAMKVAARDTVANLNIAAMDPYRRLNELREAPQTKDQWLDRTGKVENATGDPAARNPSSSALGDFQFIEETWLNVVRKHRKDLAGKPDQELLALRADPRLSREMAGHLYDENFAALKGSLKRDPTASELYLAHFLGPAGAAAVISAPAGTPVIDTLTEVVGAKKAAKMVEDNRSVLAGKTTDTVIGWSAQKMGGVIRGQGKLIDYVPEDKRLAYVAQAHNFVLQTETKDKDKIATEQFEIRAAMDNELALLQREGHTATPLSPDRIRNTLGTAELLKWQEKRKTATEVWQVTHDIPTLSDAEITARLDKLKPDPNGPDFAKREAIYNGVTTYAGKIKEARKADPAAYALVNLPVVREAWQTFQANVTDPNIPIETKREAARLYAERTIAEQERIGIPPAARTVLPKAYVQEFAARVAQPTPPGAPPGAHTNVYAQILNEAQTWGDHWPAVWQQISKEQIKPLVRVLGAGVQPEAGALLVALQDIPAKTILRDESATGWSQVEGAVREVIKPFAATLAGWGNRDQLIRDYEGQIQKLTAHYMVTDNEGAPKAAQKAYNQVLGFKYDFRDTWRVPNVRHSQPAGVPMDTIALGADEAKRRLGDPVDPILGVMPDVDKKRRGLSPEYLLAETARSHRRDGKFVAASGDVGLMLIDGEGKVVLRPDGSEFILTWGQLQRLAEEARVKAPRSTKAGARPPGSEAIERLRRM